MEIIISKEEILKLASKLKSSKGTNVETMRYSITVDIQPDTNIFEEKSSKPSLNNDFSKDLDVKELKLRRKELRDYPERGIKLKDL